MDIDKKILEYLRVIPKWKVTTYKNIGVIFWVHPRKVARVMSQNRRPDIYPCYKVVNTSWEIWWYSALDWVSSKQELLKKDWIVIKNGRIDKSYII